MHRRAYFFLIAAAICAVLIPVTEAKLRFLPIALAIVYALLSVASWADSHRRSRAGC
jgi:hypothetical protein